MNPFKALARWWKRLKCKHCCEDATTENVTCKHGHDVGRVVILTCVDCGRVRRQT